MRVAPLSQEEHDQIDWANIPPRLKREFELAPRPWLFAEISSVERLLDLIWLKQPAVDRVVPDDHTPLRIVVENVTTVGLGNLNSKSDPSWWPKARKLMKVPFDFERMRTAAITPVHAGRRVADADRFRVFEGQHRTLILALRLRSGLRFQPFRLLMLDPGRAM